ncbi:MAG: DUF5716 family protein [Eubacterium sp.]|nr:DUF5716 family protein [Eubacterium sp.]
MEGRSLIIGVDLTETRPQIARYDRKTDRMAADSLDFEGGPAFLVDVRNMWARSMAANEPGTAIIKEFTRRFKAAAAARGVEDFDRSVGALMVTVPEITKDNIAFAKAFFRELDMAEGRVFLQDHLESMFYEVMYEKEEIRNRDVGLFQFRQDQVKFSRMHLNHNTRPITGTCELHGSLTLSGSEEERSQEMQAFAQQMLGAGMYSGIILDGDSLDQSWGKPALKVLLRSGRKVFREDYLFSKGACDAARERVTEKKLKGVFYLSDGLVHLNIGMYMMSGGVNAYVPLMNAGVNWYEADMTEECILGDGKTLVFSVSRIDDPRRVQYQMVLDGLPERPPRATRLRLHLFYPEIGKCVIEVTDLGFGDFFKPCDKVWEETLEEGRQL